MINTPKQLAILLALQLAACSSSMAPDDGGGNGGSIPRPLGTATLVSGPSSCDESSPLDRGAGCYEVTVSCPGVEMDMSFNLRVGEPEGSDLGTVLFMTGGSGGTYWDRPAGAEAQRVVLELRIAGFRTVELRWIGRWWDGSSADEGAAVLACRIATAADWVYRTLHGGEVFYAVGGSGGAAQVSYPLTHYGLDDRLDMIVPFEGPPFARIDLGCLLSEETPPGAYYGPPGQRTARFDSSYGFPEEEGPCSLSDEAFREKFEDSSLAHGVRDFDHPTTCVRFIFGDAGNQNAQAQGALYIERLMEVPTNDVTLSIVPGPHALRSNPGGCQRRPRRDPERVRTALARPLEPMGEV